MISFFANWWVNRNCYIFLFSNIIWITLTSINAQFNATKYIEDNVWTQCPWWKECYNNCSQSTLQQYSCDIALSEPNNILSCPCSNIHCSRLGKRCLFHCGSEHTSINSECAACLSGRNFDNCSLSCHRDVICVSTEECDDYTCQQCSHDYYGENCDKKCSSKCQGHCHRNNGYCTHCKLGTFGKECEQSCPPQCSKNICFLNTGLCHSCNAGYFGTQCSQVCDKGYFGGRCSKRCSQNCKNGQCDHKTGRCTEGCIPGFFSIYCDRMCPGGTYGPGCFAHCPVTCETDQSIPSCDHINGVCVKGCKEGFQGSQCDTSCEKGKFGKNCEQNCSDHCFLQVCNSFSGHCLRCDSGREGPFCEGIVGAAIKKKMSLDTNLSTGQVVLIFITLFVVGGCLWLILAGSIYHRRKLMWEKLWKTGKFPSHYRMPSLWKQTMVRSALSPLRRYHKVLQYIKLQEEQKARMQRHKRRRCSSSENSEESLTSSVTVDSKEEPGEMTDNVKIPSVEEKALVIKEEGGGDAISQNVLSTNEVDSTMMGQKNAADGDTMESKTNLTISKEQMYHPPYSVNFNQIPILGNCESHMVFKSGTASSIDGNASIRYEMSTGLASGSWTHKPMQLLKATTRTSSATVRDSSNNVSVSTRRTTMSDLMKSSRITEEQTDSEILTDAASRSEADTNKFTGTDTETSSEENTEEDETEESYSSCTSSTLTEKRRRLTDVRFMIDKDKKKIDLPIQCHQVVKGKSENISKPPPLMIKPPKPPKLWNVFINSYDFLARKIPVKIRTVKPPIKLSSCTESPEKHHMSSRFILNRLEDWRRTQQKVKEVKDGVVEIVDTMRSGEGEVSSRLSLERSSIRTNDSTLADSTTRATERSQTTGTSLTVTKEKYRTSASSLLNASSEGRSISFSKRSSESQSRRSRSRPTVRTRQHRTMYSGIDSKGRMSSSYGTLLSDLTSTQRTSTSGTFRTSNSNFTTDSSANDQSIEISGLMKGRKSDVRNDHSQSTLTRSYRNRVRRSYIKKNTVIPSIREELEIISPQFPKTSLEELHLRAMDKLAMFEHHKGNRKHRLGDVPYRQKDITLCKPVKVFSDKTSSLRQVSGSSVTASRTMDNQSTLFSSMMSSTTPETGS